MARTLEELRAQARRNAQLAELRSGLVARLERIDSALAYADVWDEHARSMPAGVSIRLQPPTFTRNALRALRARVLEQLGELEAAGW